MGIRDDAEACMCVDINYCTINTESKIKDRIANVMLPGRLILRRFLTMFSLESPRNINDL